MTCALCGQEILGDDRRAAWKQMVGWVSPQGSKAMTATKPTGALAHATCIVRLKNKMPPVEQSTLF